MWHHTEKAKEKIRKSRIGRGSPHTEETKRKMSLSRMGHIISIATRNKISNSNKGQIPWIKGRHHTEETKRKISKSEKGKIVTKKTREKISRIQSKLILEGKIHPERTSKSGLFYSHKNGEKNGGFIRYRSLLELAWYQILEKSPDVQWYFPEPISIPYFWCEAIRHYIPDIRVCYKNKTVELFEVKPESLWSHPKNLAKWDAAQEWCKTRQIPTKFRVVGYGELKH